MAGAATFSTLLNQTIRNIPFVDKDYGFAVTVGEEQVMHFLLRFNQDIWGDPEVGPQTFDDFMTDLLVPVICTNENQYIINSFSITFDFNLVVFYTGYGIQGVVNGRDEQGGAPEFEHLLFAPDDGAESFGVPATRAGLAIGYTDVAGFKP